MSTDQNSCPNKLEELVGQFSATFEVSSEPNRTEAPHPRFSSYYKNKSRTTEESQDSRRQARLKEQKAKRFDLLQQLRGSTSDDIECAKTENESITSHDSENFRMDHSSDSLDSSGSTVKFRYYRNHLMMSEWLVDIPLDFEENWLMVLCPIGKRCLVVANQGETKVYARNGYCFKSHFPSLLPGGNKRDQRGHKENSILDCIYCEQQNKFYILDLVSWNGMSFRESETEFRFYWLNSKLREMKGSISTVSAFNPYKFEMLAHFVCDKSTISSVIKTLPFEEELDGLLFFHKECHYVSEVTPLVCWLKLEMLPSILGIPIDINTSAADQSDTNPDCDMNIHDTHATHSASPNHNQLCMDTGTS